MKIQLKMVRELHDAFDLEYSKRPTKDIPKDLKQLRIKLIHEEFAELTEALEDEPLENVAKELTDLQYVLFDMVLALGMQDKVEEMFEEVHRSNMSKLDKGIRVIMAAAIALLYYYDVVQGLLAYILMAIAIILLITSLINFCPLYSVLGINTCKVKK